jgi:TrmH family RNA methyltransferase
MIREIAGRQNHAIKLDHKLQKKKNRRERGLLVCEGLDLLEIASECGAEIKEVFLRSDLVRDLPASVIEAAEADRLDVGICSEEGLAAASSLGGAADVFFLCKQPEWDLTDLDLASSLAVYLDEVGDPGNVGTLTRSAVAFGAAGLICSPRTADPFGPKAMRAGMGAQFMLPVVVEVSAADLFAKLEKLGSGCGADGKPAVQVLVADSRGGVDVRQTVDEPVPGEASTPVGGTIIVLGAERTGPGEAWQDRPRVFIPQRRFDSLNVAMAGTILLYELAHARDGQGQA